MKAARIGFVAAGAAALTVAVACSDDGGASDTEVPIADSGTPTVRADARTIPPDAGPPISTMRLAHLASDTGPIDFCYQEAHAGAFIGPVFGGPPPPDASADADADSDAALAPSKRVEYGVVTRYVVVQGAGAMTIAVVEAGATSCANPIAKGDITLDPGKLSTVALFSRPADGGAPILDVAAFTDDRQLADDEIRVRVIHAALGTHDIAPAGALAVRASAAKTTVLADRVEPRHAATPSDAVGVDALGYVTAAPVPPPVVLAIGPAPTDGGADAGFEPWLSKASDLGLTGGSLHTAFILNAAPPATKAPTTDRQVAFQVLWCSDTTTDGDRTTCTWVR